MCLKKAEAGASEPPPKQSMSFQNIALVAIFVALCILIVLFVCKRGETATSRTPSPDVRHFLNVPSVDAVDDDADDPPSITSTPPAGLRKPKTRRAPRVRIQEEEEEEEEEESADPLFQPLQRQLRHKSVG